MIYTYILCSLVWLVLLTNASELAPGNTSKGRFTNAQEAKELALEAYHKSLNAPKHEIGALQKEALKHAYASLETERDQDDLEYVVGMVHMRRGQLARAESHFQKVLDSSNHHIAIDGLEGLIDIENRRKKIARELVGQQSLPFSDVGLIATDLIKQLIHDDNTGSLGYAYNPRDTAFIMYYATADNTTLATALINQLIADQHQVAHQTATILLPWLVNDSLVTPTKHQIDTLIQWAGKRPDTALVKTIGHMLHAMDHRSFDHLEWFATHNRTMPEETLSLLLENTETSIEPMSADQLIKSTLYRLACEHPLSHSALATLCQKALEQAASGLDAVSSIMTNIESMHLSPGDTSRIHRAAARYHARSNALDTAMYHYTKAVTRDPELSPEIIRLLRSAPKKIRGAHELERTIIEQYEHFVASSHLVEHHAALVQMMVNRFGPDGTCSDRINGKKSIAALEEYVAGLEKFDSANSNEIQQILNSAYTILAGHYCSYSKKNSDLTKGIEYRDRIIARDPAGLEQLADLLIKKQNIDGADATLKLLNHYLCHTARQSLPESEQCKQRKARIAFKHGALILRLGVKSSQVAAAAPTAYRLFSYAASLLSVNDRNADASIDYLWSGEDRSILSQVTELFVHGTATAQERFALAPHVERFARLTLNDEHTSTASRSLALSACQHLSDLGNLRAALMLHKHTFSQSAHPSDYFSDALLKHKAYEAQYPSNVDTQLMQETTDTILGWRDGLGYSSLELACDLIIAHPNDLSSLLRRLSATDYLDVIGLVTHKGFISDNMNREQLKAALSILTSYCDSSPQEAKELLISARQLCCYITTALMQTTIGDSIKNISAGTDESLDQMAKDFNTQIVEINNLIRDIAQLTARKSAMIRLEAYVKLIEAIFLQTIKASVAGEKIDQVVKFCKESLARVNKDESEEFIELAELFKLTLKKKFLPLSKHATIINDIQKLTTRVRSRSGLLLYIASTGIEAKNQLRLLDQAARRGNRSAIRESEMLNQLVNSKKK